MHARSPFGTLTPLACSGQALRPLVKTRVFGMTPAALGLSFVGYVTRKSDSTLVSFRFGKVVHIFGGMNISFH